MTQQLTSQINGYLSPLYASAILTTNVRPTNIGSHWSGDSLFFTGFYLNIIEV